MPSSQTPFSIASACCWSLLARWPSWDDINISAVRLSSTAIIAFAGIKNAKIIASSLGLIALRIRPVPLFIGLPTPPWFSVSVPAFILRLKVYSFFSNFPVKGLKVGLACCSKILRTVSRAVNQRDVKNAFEPVFLWNWVPEDRKWASWSSSYLHPGTFDASGVGSTSSDWPLLTGDSSLGGGGW